MKRTIFFVALLVVLLPAIGFCQEAKEANEKLQSAVHQAKLRHMETEAAEQEAQVDFDVRMRELDIEEREIELEHMRKKLSFAGHRKHPHKKHCLFLMICLIIHILVAVWVYKDIRKRNAGSGIWIVIALLAGLFGVLVYAIVRLGDSRQT